MLLNPESYPRKWMVLEPNRKERLDWVTGEELNSLRACLLLSVIRGHCHLHTFSMDCLSESKQASVTGCIFFLSFNICFLLFPSDDAAGIFPAQAHCLFSQVFMFVGSMTPASRRIGSHLADSVTRQLLRLVPSPASLFLLLELKASLRLTSCLQPRCCLSVEPVDQGFCHQIYTMWLVISCLSLQIVGCLVLILGGGDCMFDSPPWRPLCHTLLLWVAPKKVGIGKQHQEKANIVLLLL